MNISFPSTAPQTKKELFARLQTAIETGWYKMPSEKRYNGTGGAGNFLEDLLGSQAGKMDIADSTGWEVKSYTEKTALITLFHKEAQPVNIMRYMVSKYGQKDRLGRLGFRHTIRGKSDRFKVVDDNGQVIVRPLAKNGSVPYWTHADILNGAAKLKRMLLVKLERNEQEVRFIEADCFENFYLQFFTYELACGTVAIDFDVREAKPGSKGLRNHGTKFRVPPRNVCRLYTNKSPFKG